MLRLINGLLALETSISRGRSPFPDQELASRLMLVDRLLTMPLRDLACFGLPVPLPSPAMMIQQTITQLEVRRATRFPQEAMLNPPIEPVLDS